MAASWPIWGSSRPPILRTPLTHRSETVHSGVLQGCPPCTRGLTHGRLANRPSLASWQACDRPQRVLAVFDGPFLAGRPMVYHPLVCIFLPLVGHAC